METKNLCAHIPIELHAQVCEAKTAMHMNTDQYITNLLRTYFNVCQAQKTGGIADQLREVMEEKQSLVDSIDTARAEELRKANQNSRLEELTECMEQNSQGFTHYDDEMVRKMVERITVIDAETIRVKMRDTDLEIEQTVC